LEEETRMGEFVQFEVHDGVGAIRLNRPPMNAINEDVVRDLQQVATEVSVRDDVRAAVIWGGDELFAAGADVNMMLPMTPQQVKPVITALQDGFTVFEDIPKVTVAAITGFCLGGGLELAMCADLRYAAANARLGQPEILLGIIPGAGGTQRLPRIVGVGRAKEMIYSGRHLRADEAKSIGLVHEVHPAEEVYDRAIDTARRYAKGPTEALRAAKVAINWGARGEFRAGIVLEREVFADLFSTEDQKTGMRSLLERGPGKATFAGK
jgi:enoyl-CoA hydratase/carnithine racemase